LLPQRRRRSSAALPGLSILGYSFSLSALVGKRSTSIRHGTPAEMDLFLKIEKSQIFFLTPKSEEFV
jgi:hypothetical protein